MLSNSDIVHFIISPDWPVLIKHSIIFEILWKSKKIFPLRPVINDGGIVKLEIISPNQLNSDNITLRMSPKHLGGYGICLYDDELYRGGKRDRHDAFLPKMKLSLDIMQTEGEKLESHGFAYLWTDDSKIVLAPYCISIVCVAPFQMLERYYRKNRPSLSDFAISLSKILVDDDPLGHSISLSSICESANNILKEFSSPSSEGYNTFDVLRQEGNKNRKFIYCSMWGVFQDFAKDLLLTNSMEVRNITSIHDYELLQLVLDKILDENYNDVPRELIDEYVNKKENH